ncbi:YetF domain-containing protein [Marivirga lumbricoides]
MDKILFTNWESIGRTFIIGVLSYIVLIILLRSSGKRTLSKMNAFDFVITIALGSTFANLILNKSVSLADGAVAFFTLIFLQYAITWLSVRSKRIKHLITSEPVLILYKGELQHRVIKKERITIEEINLSIRKKGISSLEEVDAIILETTGDFTVVPSIKTENTGVLDDVNNFPPGKNKSDK